jgi:hypothetical protein
MHLGCSSSSNNAAGAGGSSSNAGTGGGGNRDGGAEDPTCPSNATLTASSSHNFSFWSVVDLPTLTKVAPKSELSFDWSGVTTDFLTKPLDPAKDVVLVTVALWEITPDQFANQINDDTLGSPAVAAFLQTEGKLTQTKLFSLAPPAGPIPRDQMLSFFDIDIYPPGKNFYTFMIGSDLTPGMATRMIGGFELSADTTNTDVKLTNDSTQLDYDVDFSNSVPTGMPEGIADITIDWSGMETSSATETDPQKLNAAGQPFLKRSIKQVRVGRYSKTEAELKQKESILKIDDVADTIYVGDVTSGSKLNLSTLKDSSGNSFKGIDTSHTWLLALINTDSKNPAPWYLTFLKVCK